jgi:hypothetical protein
VVDENTAILDSLKDDDEPGAYHIGDWDNDSAR